MYKYIRAYLELMTDKRAVATLDYGLIAGTMIVVGLAAKTGVNANFYDAIHGVKAIFT